MSKTIPAHHIRGLIAATLTPFDAGGQVNCRPLAAYGRLLNAAGVAGVFVNGTTGEGASLSIRERLTLAEAWRQCLPQGMKLIIHVGDNSVQHVEELARHAQQIGADAIAAVAPSFFRPADHRDLLGFFRRALATVPDMPFYFYHMPSMTGVALPMVRLLAMADEELPSLVGIKFTHWDLAEYAACREYAQGRYDMLYGRDETLLAGLSCGALGAVGSTYNMFAPLYTQLIASFTSGDLGEARRLQSVSRRAIETLLEYESVMAAGKAVLRHAGIDMGSTRQPLRGLDTQREASLLSRLKDTGVLEYLPRL